MTANAKKRRPTAKVPIDAKLEARIVRLTKSGLTRKEVAAKLGNRSPGDLPIMVVQVRHGLVQTTNAYVLERAGKTGRTTKLARPK